MVKTKELVHYLDSLLSVSQFKDHCPNGCQVAGSDDVQMIVSGVTACQALLDAALEHQPQAILVHHGYFWKHDSPCIQGPHKKRIKTLLTHDVNLLAYHLPLDAHLQFGNNRQLIKQLDLDVDVQEPVAVHGTQGLLWYGDLKKPLSVSDVAQSLENTLQRIPLCIEASELPIKRLAWCTGGAQDFIVQAAELGADAYITGEVSERTYHQAQELGVHFFSAGHHATERYGVQALGQHLAAHFGVLHHFIDVDNPV